MFIFLSFSPSLFAEESSGGSPSVEFPEFPEFPLDIGSGTSSGTNIPAFPASEPDNVSIPQIGTDSPSSEFPGSSPASISLEIASSSNPSDVLPESLSATETTSVFPVSIETSPASSASETSFPFSSSSSSISSPTYEVASDSIPASTTIPISEGDSGAEIISTDSIITGEIASESSFPEPQIPILSEGSTNRLHLPPKTGTLVLTVESIQERTPRMISMIAGRVEIWRGDDALAALNAGDTGVEEAFHKRTFTFPPLTLPVGYHFITLRVYREGPISREKKWKGETFQIGIHVGKPLLLKKRLSFFVW